MKLSAQSYGKVLYELTKDATAKEMDKIVAQYILFLTRGQMLSKIKYIIKEFVDYAKEKNGISQLKIISARTLSRLEIESIAKHFGKKTETSADTDKSIMGGVIIKNKNKILDASLKTQLKKLKTQLL